MVSMKKVEHFICDICGTEYKSSTFCVQYESKHSINPKITQCRYLPITQDSTGYPIAISVKMDDGKTVVYKR